MKMFQGMYNTFVVDTGCNEIGVPLHFLEAFPIATPIPAYSNIGMSFPPSPKAIVSSREIPK